MKEVSQNRNSFTKRFLNVLLIISFVILAILGGFIVYMWSYNVNYRYYGKSKVSVEKIPFPAVTICPNHIFDAQKFNISKTTDEDEIDLNDAKTLEALSFVCDNIQWPTYNDTSENYNRASYLNLIQKISPMNELIDNLTFYNSKNATAIKEYFVKVMSKHGPCITFNLVNGKDLCYKRSCYYLEHNDYVGSYSWYENDVRNRKNYPLRTKSGIDQGLSLKLNIHKKSVHKYCRNKLGYKVLIHPSNEFPFNHHTFDISIDADAEFKISPTITSITKKLIKAENRNCYMKNEKKLRNYFAYTKSNCELECTAQHMKNMSMLPFNIPYLDSYDSDNEAPFDASLYIERKYCLNAICSAEYKNVIRSEKFQENLKKCECLPLCKDIQYEIELKERKFDQNSSENYTAYVKVYYNDEQAEKKVLKSIIEHRDLFAALAFVSCICLIIIAFKINTELHYITNFFTSVWKSFSSYSSNSTFHSVSYIGNKNIDWKLRIFWIVIFITATSLCVYINIENYKKWQDRPIIVTLDETSTHISEIPFPAVTICKNFYHDDFCSLYPLEKRDGEVITCGKEENSESYLDKKLKAVALKFVCKKFELYFYAMWSIGPSINIAEDTIVSYKDTDEVYNNTSTAKLINAIKSFVDDRDKVEGEFGKQHNKIQSRITLTGEGICRTFNMAYDQDLFKFIIPDSFVNHEKEDEFISRYRSTQLYVHTDYDNANRYINSSGIQYGLNFLVDEKNTTNKCDENSNFKIEIHSPYDYPQPEINGFEISTDVDTKFILKPVITKASEDLISYPIEIRKCVFDNEIELKFFQKYTKSNCELECKINSIFKSCNCTPYFLPHTEGTKACVTFEDYQCYVSQKMSFNPKQSECNCWPLCNQINYKYDASSTTGNVANSKFNIYYGDEEIVATIKTERSSWTDFISNFGGILGLLMGGSMLSVIELIYHFCIKKMEKQPSEE